MKSIWKSRTMWVAILQGVLGIVLVLETELPGVGWVAIVKSAVDIVLRYVTTQPVGTA